MAWAEIQDTDPLTAPDRALLGTLGRGPLDVALQVFFRVSPETSSRANSMASPETATRMGGRVVAFEPNSVSCKQIGLNAGLPACSLRSLQTNRGLQVKHSGTTSALTPEFGAKLRARADNVTSLFADLP